MFINAEPYNFPYDGDLTAKNTALIIIDMQNVYGEGGEWFCPASKAAADNIVKLLTKKN